jgi:hypothetical protein
MFSAQPFREWANDERLRAVTWASWHSLLGLSVDRTEDSSRQRRHLERLFRHRAAPTTTLPLPGIFISTRAERASRSLATTTPCVALPRADSGTVIAQLRSTAMHITDWLQLIRAEYMEIPGLHLTRPQVRRLWDLVTAEALVAAAGGREVPEMHPSGRVRARGYGLMQRQLEE